MAGPTTRVRIIDDQWRSAAEVVARRHKLTVAQLCNQAALDIAGYCWDNLPPQDANTFRSRLTTFLKDPIAISVKLAKSGKRKGQFIRRGRKSRQLTRANLIAQYWRKKAGGKGLYGEQMRKYTSVLTKRRLVGVGSVKAVFLPVIRALNPLAKFKFPFAKTRGQHIAIWPGSRGFGIAVPAAPATAARAEFTVGYDPKRDNQSAKLQTIYERVVSEAFSWKRGRMIKEAEKVLQEDVRGV